MHIKGHFTSIPLLIAFALMLTSCGPNDIQQDVSADFPYKSKYLDVLGSKMHYVEVGQGDPILFLHGNPTSSYLWRNVIPHLKDQGTCIAVDLIGMGKSEKPDIDYTFVDHARYLEAFIKQKNLKNVTLVIHDWGSGLGFHYATRHQSNVRGIVFMEALWRPLSWDNFGIIESFIFKRLRDPETGHEMVIKDNMFIEKMLPEFTARELSETEMNYYREPFKEEASRKPILMWPGQIPIDGEPAEMQTIVSNYYEKLKSWNVPKLLLYAEPGAIIKGEEVATEIKNTYANTEMVYVGGGVHYIQEDNPDKIGRAISEWMNQKLK